MRVPLGADKRMLAPQRVYLLAPALPRRPRNQPHEPPQRALHVASGGNVGPPDLADLRLVDIEVNDSRAGRKPGNRARGAVIEPHSQGYQEVRPVDGEVRCPAAVHAEHSQGKGMIGSITPSPMSVQTTGMPHASLRDLTSSTAPEAMTPPPT